MHNDEEEYIAYRHDKYTHTNGEFPNLEDEFSDEIRPDFKWNKFVYDYNAMASSDISFKRVRRQDEEEPPAEPPDSGGDEVEGGGSGEGGEGEGGGGGTSKKEPQLFLTPIIGLTAFFAVIFILGPCFVRKGPNRGVTRCCIMLTAFCMWLFWVTVYIAQMNPLMGPRLENTTVAWIAEKLGNAVQAPPNAEIPEGDGGDGGDVGSGDVGSGDDTI